MCILHYYNILYNIIIYVYIIPQYFILHYLCQYQYERYNLFFYLIKGWSKINTVITVEYYFLF